jgi:sterol desaturase/sphingolipid hydroxylase (fatty acid hydroxylase superfamily)
MLSKTLFNCLIIVLGIFLSGTLTAFMICLLYNQPFINPSFTKQQILDRFVDILKNSIFILCIATLFTAFIFKKMLPNSAHSWRQTIFTVIIFSIAIEFFYYIYHRIVHKIGYELIHEKHHRNEVVYPFDTFDFTFVDSLNLVVSIGLPLLLIPVTVLEQCIILYIYVTSSYLSHSQLFYDHHHKHHYLKHCNYCIFLPIFDILFGTYK